VPKLGDLWILEKLPAEGRNVLFCAVGTTSFIEFRVFFDQVNRDVRTVEASWLIVMAQPNSDTSSLEVYKTHHFDLCCTLIVIILVDTEGIRP
jgi:hypothetical protein